MKFNSFFVEVLEQRRLLAAQIGANFGGTTRAASGFIPPDTMGAVGPAHFIEIINGRYRVYGKTGTQLRNRSLDQFWNDAGIASLSSFSFDPRIEFDANSQRWYAASTDGAASTSSGILFAVSLSANPLDGFVGFRVDADPLGLRWADFPQMGYDGNGVYLCANMFDAPGGIAESTEVSILVLPKVDLLLPAPSIARSNYLQNVASTTGFSVQPVTAPNNAPQQGVLVSGNASSINFTQISGSIFSPTVVNLSDPSLTGRSIPPMARQPDGSRTLQSGGDARIRSSVQYAMDSYWIVQGIDSPSFDSAAIRMLRIAGATRSILQEAILESASLDFIYGSVGVNFRGDVVIGSTGVGLGQFASTYAHTGTTVGNTTTFDAPVLLQAGSGNYSALDSSGRNRWGDYSHTTVDPSDPTRIWTIQEFAPSTNQWQTKITELRFAPPAPSAPDLQLTSDTGASGTDNLTADNTPTFTGTGSPGATVTLTANGIPVGSGVVDVGGNYTVTVSTLNDGLQSIVATQSLGTLTSPPSSALAITIDTVAPALVTARFDFETAHQVSLMFGEVPITQASALSIFNSTTAQFVPDASKIITIVGNDVRVQFSSLLADGVYLLTAIAGAVTDLAGNGSAAISFSAAGNPINSFFVLTGDANRNRSVNFDDLLTLAQNYGQTGRTFSQGNFNYSADGLVGFDDLLLLAQRYETSLLSLGGSTVRSRRSSAITRILE